jgi:Rrf2 family iron-sulfur cluster assembly transcriptional regulator
MRLTTKGRHAVAAMIDLALRGGAEPVVLASISQRQNVSLSYLEALFGLLRRRALVRAVRGKGGGYLLGRPAAHISVADIVGAVDQPIVAIGCGGRGDCRGTGTGHCATHELWAGLDARLLECLTAVSLQELVDTQQPGGESAEASPARSPFWTPRPVLTPVDAAGPNSVFALADVLARQATLDA